jgi:DNA-binding transcriptional LysR family regulator
MSIDIRHLRAFIAVAEELNFRRASERLLMAQPALSRTIMDAESLVGFRLFDRSTRVVRLTPAGTVLLAQSRDILERLEAAIKTARRVERGELGTLQVGYNDFAINGLLPAILMHFRRTYPNVNLNLRSLTSPEMAEMIRERSLDIAFLTGANLAADLASTVMRQERMVCLLPKGHRLADSPAVPLRELAHEPFVMGARAGWRSYLELVDGFCMKAGFKPKIVHEADFSDGIVGLVAAGMGVSIYVEGQWLNARDLVVRRFVEEPPEVYTIAAWHPELRSSVLGNFVAAVQAVIGSS